MKQVTAQCVWQAQQQHGRKLDRKKTILRPIGNGEPDPHCEQQSDAKREEEGEPMKELFCALVDEPFVHGAAVGARRATLAPPHTAHLHVGKDEDDRNDRHHLRRTVGEGVAANRHHVLLWPTSEGDQIVERHGVHEDIRLQPVHRHEGLVLCTLERAAIEDDMAGQERIDVFIDIAA